MAQSSSTFKQNLLKARNNSNKPVYKRLFLGGKGKEYVLRFLDTEVISPDDSSPFINVWLHGGFMHPNYDSKYPSNFHCMFGDCPLCKEYNKEAELEFRSNVPKDKRTAWRKQRKKYAMYWAINKTNGANDLTLVLVPDQQNKFKDKKTGKETIYPSLQDLLFDSLVEAAEQELTPFNLKGGNDILISSQVKNNKTIFSFRVDQKYNDVDPQMVKKFKTMPQLNSIYKKLHEYDLQCIAEGKKIQYGSQERKDALQAQDRIEKVNNEMSSEDMDTNVNVEVTDHKVHKTKQQEQAKQAQAPVENKQPEAKEESPKESEPAPAESPEETVDLDSMVDTTYTEEEQALLNTNMDEFQEINEADLDNLFNEDDFGSEEEK